MRPVLILAFIAFAPLPERAADSSVPKDWEKLDYATVELGHPWDFDTADICLQKPYHAKLEVVKEGGKPVLVASADGLYSSPIIGSITGGFNGEKYHRLLIRARHEGPTPTGLLVNDKVLVRDSAGGTDLKTDFDVYEADMTGAPDWGKDVEALKLRWSNKPGNPTDQDKIIVEWIRLLAD